MLRSASLQKIIPVDADLLEDGAQTALWHIALIVRDGGVAVQRGSSQILCQPAACKWNSRPSCFSRLIIHLASRSPTQVAAGSGARAVLVGEGQGLIMLKRQSGVGAQRADSAANAATCISTVCTALLAANTPL